MSPYFNTETGEITRGDDLTTEPALSAPLTEQDRQQQEDRARREQIGTGKKPAEPPGDPGGPPGAVRDRAQFGREEYEHMRVAALADPTHPLNDPRHPDHDATIEKYLRLGEMADGHDYDDPEQNEVLGELHEGARILAPEDTPEVRVPTLSAIAEEQGFTWDRELHEELVTATDESGLPRHHVEQVFRSVAEAAEALALDEDADTPEAGIVELVRTEGSGRARQIVIDAQELIDRLFESKVPAFVQAADSLVDVSNHPGVLRACAQLYGELKNLPPQGPWEKLLLGTAERWAKNNEITDRPTEELPEDYELGNFGRP